jgi:signal peptidase I
MALGVPTLERKHLTMGRSSATLQPAPRVAKVENRAQATEGHRETVEAIVVAFILALVVRGFEAQAFVIPTGSMAPTLMGRHKEIPCPQCGFTYAVNASSEVEGRSSLRTVYSGICVNCRFHASRLNDAPSFKGDRILVMMLPYDLPFLPGSGPPERWDVVVFRYPEDPEVSYIKRLVGLPGETIKIYHGDIFVKTAGTGRFEQARKPMRHQVATQIPVYDDRHQPAILKGKPEWQRWRSDGSGWTSDDSSKSRYQAKARSSGEWVELRYENLVPDPEQWEAIQDDRALPRPPRSTLITDFYSYNTNIADEFANLADEVQQTADVAWMQPHWVGDLTVQMALDVSDVGTGGSVRFELVKGGAAHQCTIDLATGKAVVTRGDVNLGEWETPIKGSGHYQVSFANVDQRISLMVDGRAVGGDGIPFESGEEMPVPTAADLAPAAIAARNASVAVADLVLKRDIYYTQSPGSVDYAMVWEGRPPRSPKELFDFLSDPSRFAKIANVRYREFEIRDDHFFMLGDNSPCSKDSRGWTTEDQYDPDRPDRGWDRALRRSWEVPRRLITGKAFFVYWPHGVPIWPNIAITRDFRIPFIPYIARMKWIR